MKIAIKERTATSCRDIASEDCSNSELDCYTAIGKHLKEATIPSEWIIETSLGNAVLKIQKRGTYADKNGNRVPSMFVTFEYDDIDTVASPPTEFEEKYLTCINPGSNNYKFYHFIPQSDGVQAEYGRIGAQDGDMYAPRRLQKPMDVKTATLRYFEKLTKGYEDQTEIFVKDAVKPKAKKKASTPRPATNPSMVLFDLLQGFSKGYVAEKLISTDVTFEQVAKARKIWNAMAERKTVNGFNKQLLALMKLSPRKTRDVKLMMADKTDDFGKIVDREENLLLAMEGLVGIQADADKADADDEFKSLGIDVFEATAEQKQHVFDHLPDNLKAKVKTVYRVIPKKQKAKFSRYLKDNNIHHGTGQIREFWHGSANENWLSIVEKSLMLHPNAQICGKMLGNGLYFAPSPSKSWGYTSSYGSRWTHGNSGTAIMGLYATAYGSPLIVGKGNGYTLRKYDEPELKRLGKSCVYAPAGADGWLRADELCFFNEAAVVLNYLVVFKA